MLKGASISICTVQYGTVCRINNLKKKLAAKLLYVRTYIRGSNTLEIHQRIRLHLRTYVRYHPQHTSRYIMVHSLERTC